MSPTSATEIPRFAPKIPRFGISVPHSLHSNPETTGRFLLNVTRERWAFPPLRYESHPLAVPALLQHAKSGGLEGASDLGGAIDDNPRGDQFPAGAQTRPQVAGHGDDRVRDDIGNHYIRRAFKRPGAIGKLDPNHVAKPETLDIRPRGLDSH